jgi:hypothetical protein
MQDLAKTILLVKELTVNLDERRNPIMPRHPGTAPKTGNRQRGGLCASLGEERV